MKDGLAIISVTYNNYPLLEDFFASLKKQKNKAFYLYMNDLSETKKQIEMQGVDGTIIPGANKGYAFGVNEGIKKALADGYEKFCIINDDTFFKEDFVDKAIKSLEEHQAAVIGGKIYYAPHHEYHTDKYTTAEEGRVLWYAGGRIDWDHMMTTHRGVDEVDHGQFDKVEETGFITGCLTLFDKSVLDKIGLWDESYFLYFEDADFCIRAVRAKIKLLYDPHVAIWHKVSQSTGGSGSSTHQKYQGKNQVKIGLKYAPLRTKFHLVKNYVLRGLK